MKIKTKIFNKLIMNKIFKKKRILNLKTKKLFLIQIK